MSNKGTPVKSYSPFRASRDAAREGATEGAGTQSLVCDEECRRRDGRSPEECRAAFIKLGTVSQASGSAYLEMGTTKVIVSVFGPREGRQEGPASGATSGSGRLNVHVTVAPFARARRVGRALQSSPEEQELSRVLVSALTPAIQLKSFPKASLDVTGLVLEAGGSEAAVLVQCASAALADAGVQLFDLLSCATVSVWRDVLMLDPVAEEEREEEGMLTLALMPSANQVTLMHFAGDLQPQQLSQALELATAGCLKMDEILRLTIREDIEGTE